MILIYIYSIEYAYIEVSVHYKSQFIIQYIYEIHEAIPDH